MSSRSSFRSRWRREDLALEMIGDTEHERVHAAATRELHPDR
jgi:hypothetical protein